MSKTLIIMLPASGCSADSDVNWILVDAANHVADSGATAIGALSGRLAAVDTDEVVAVAPAETVLSLQVTIPSTQLRQIKQALPFAIEELIADDLENVHVAIPHDFRAGLPAVDTLVIAHRQLIEWLDVLHSNHLSPAGILVDALCLPVEQNGWTLLVDGERIVLRTATNGGMAVQKADFHLVLESLLQSDRQARGSGDLSRAVRPQLQVIASQSRAGDCEAVKTISRHLKKQFPDYDVKATVYRQDVAQLLSLDWQDQKSRGINLLQGGYAIANPSGARRNNWGMAAAIAMVGLGVYLMVALAGGWYFNNRADALEHQSVAMYRRLFPDEHRVVDPRKQMQSHIRQSGGGQGDNSFLVLLAETAKQMQGDPSAKAVTLKQIRFDREQKGLRFEVNSRTLDQLDQFKNRLSGGGLQVDINSASEQGHGVLGRIVVTQR